MAGVSDFDSHTAPNDSANLELQEASEKNLWIFYEPVVFFRCNSHTDACFYIFTVIHSFKKTKPDVIS